MGFGLKAGTRFELIGLSAPFGGASLIDDCRLSLGAGYTCVTALLLLLFISFIGPGKTYKLGGSPMARRVIDYCISVVM